MGKQTWSFLKFGPQAAAGGIGACPWGTITTNAVKIHTTGGGSGGEGSATEAVVAGGATLVMLF
jgi:hypothetical protein